VVHGPRRRARAGRRAETALTRALLVAFSAAVVAAGCAGPAPTLSPPGEVVRRFAVVLAVAPSAPLDLELLADEVDASLDATGLAGETTVSRTVNGIEIHSTAGQAQLSAALGTILVAPGPARLLDPRAGEVAEDGPVDPTWLPLLGGTWVDATSVNVTTDPRGRRTVVHLRFAADAAGIFSAWTAAHVGSAFVIEVAGRIASVPTANEAIPGDELLIVTTSEEEAIRLAAALRAAGGMTFVEQGP
jgi:hypothetical protein